jgi:hypothetical protein
MSERSQAYVALLSVIDLCVDSSAHGLTSAACRGVLCLDMLDSDSRSHAAVVHMSAVGLQVLVAKNISMYLEKGVRFANDKKLQEEVSDHLSKQKDHFQNHWTNAFEEAVAQGTKQFINVPDNLKDIDIQSSWPILGYQSSFTASFSNPCPRKHTKRAVGLALRNAGIKANENFVASEKFANVLNWAVAILSPHIVFNKGLNDVFRSFVNNKIEIFTIQTYSS